MSNILIDFNITVNKLVNDNIFMESNGDVIISTLKRQVREESIHSYSYSQYQVLIHSVAYNYCLFLFFLVLNALKDETILESERRCKDLYHFDDIQTNLAHIGINLDSIYNSIVLNYIPVEYEQ